ncbi:MAG: tRNA1(Val) (adenine(37)-N6)-methyltransferase [Candidatus Cryptobacteroides sp.]
MAVFRFKQFDVVNERSAMRVNTDGVLLGASVTLLPSDRNILDVGTGTGTIALMVAQRLSLPFHITGIDIDEDSATEAAFNFANSPWKDSMQAIAVSLTDYDAGPFDLIVSNPPYFDSSLKAPELRRRNARHTDTLSYRELIEYSATHLAPEGRLSFILPSEFLVPARRLACGFSLYPFRILSIKTVPHKPASRVVMEFSRTKTLDIKEDSLVIQQEGRYTEAYRSLTADFLTLKY